MTKKMKLTVGDESLYADLCVGEAPDTVAALEGAGAFESVVFSADVCYGELTFATPVADYWLEQNVQPQTRPGDVTYYNDWSAICIFTQKMEQFGPGAKVAQISAEDLPRFQALYDKVWHHQSDGIRVGFEVVDVDEDSDGEVHVGPPAPVRRPQPPAVARMESLLQDVWLERPAELDDMRLRNASTGRELGVWAYAWGELVNLSDMLLMLMRMAREKNGSVRTLRAVAAEQCRFFSGIFGSSAHMAGTKLVLAEAASYFDAVEGYDSFIALARAVQRWAVQMSFWCDMELPWDRMSATLHEAWNPDAGASEGEARGNKGKHGKHGKADKKGKSGKKRHKKK